MAGAKANNVESTSRQDSAHTTNKRRARKPTKFTLFPKLPIELRHKIWGLALPDARVIEILWNSEMNKYYTDAPPPTILRVNRESRGETLRFYDAWVVNVRQKSPAILSRMTRSANLTILFGTYINFATDTVYISSDHLGHLKDQGHLQIFAEFFIRKLSLKVTRLAIKAERDWEDLDNLSLQLFTLGAYMVFLGSPRKLLCVVNDDHCCDSDGLIMHGRGVRFDVVKVGPRDNIVDRFTRKFEDMKKTLLKSPYWHEPIDENLRPDVFPARITRERARRNK